MKIVITVPFGELTLNETDIQTLISDKKIVDSILLMLINGDDTWENDNEVEFSKKDAKLFLSEYFKGTSYSKTFITETLNKIE